MCRRYVFSLLLLMSATASSHADTWERFRGPDGAGVAVKQNLPVEFDDTKNLIWKIKVPGLGNSSPIVWNDKVFLQSASADGAERYLLCLDVKDGKTIWQKKTAGAKAPTHAKNTLASATPVTDGESVFYSTWDGKDVFLSAVTIKGEPMWEKNLGEFKSQHGPGASPILYKDKVYYNFDMDGKAVLYVFDKATGKPAWSQPREAFRASYSAPQILEKGANGTELLITTTTAITSYNPDTGSRNWDWKWTWGPKTKPLRTIAQSVEMGGVLYAFSGDGGGDRQMVALNLPAAAGARPEQTWDNKKDFPYVPCVIGDAGRLYFVNDRGFAGCFDGKSGKQIYMQRLPEATFTASPILVDGKIYAGSEEGDVFVFPASPKFEILAKNRIGERIRATPAVADGKLYVRGAEHLYCFGKKQ